MITRTPKRTSLLGAVGIVVLSVGAVGSVGSMLRAGRHNSSRILLLLFAGWVLAPFIALGWAYLVSERWSVITRVTLHAAMLAVALGSLAIYAAVAFGPPRAKTAPLFVVVPPVSLLLSAAVVAGAVLWSRRKGGSK